MDQCTSKHKHMKYLVAVAHQIERPRLPLLGHSVNINCCSCGICCSHKQLQTKCHVDCGVVPVNPQCVRSRNHAWKPHAQEQGCTERSILRGGESRGKEWESSEDTKDWDSWEVDYLKCWVAHEGVVDRRYEGGNDHETDARVVHAPTEEVDPMWVAS